jgi:L-methionine (R)-S-oxide reductase
MPGSELAHKLKEILALKLGRAPTAARIAGAIRSGGDYRWVGIYDVDRRRGMVVNVAWSGPDAPVYPTFPVGKGLTARAIASGKTVNVGDVAADAGYLTALEGTRSEIIVPVLDRAGAVVGTIDVESERLDAFDTATQALLEECAQAIVGFWDGGA